MEQTLSEKIWQRGSAREIMREARERFRENSREDLPGAYVALASVHYSLIKRYMAWWRLPLAVWHMWRATWNTKCALAVSSDPSHMTHDQLDIISTILVKVPRLFGGNSRGARWVLVFALNHQYEPPMKPHTRALMLISLARIEEDQAKITGYYQEAHNLISLIANEESPDREYQLIRVRAAVGFFYFDHGERGVARNLIRLAYPAAIVIAKDQARKIEAECRKRGFRQVDLLG